MPEKFESTGPSLDTVVIFTSRMKELAEFYKQGLGIGPFQESPQHLGCLVGSVYLGFDQVDDDSSDGRGTRGAAVWFTVDDIHASFDRLVDAGATVRYSPTKKPWGAVLASLEDPDGNIFGISQRSETDS
ncbi:VOC family protein [Candidatus Bipolaricaulota bacterium]